MPAPMPRAAVAGMLTLPPDIEPGTTDLLLHALPALQHGLGALLVEQPA